MVAPSSPPERLSTSHIEAPGNSLQAPDHRSPQILGGTWGRTDGIAGSWPPISCRHRALQRNYLDAWTPCTGRASRYRAEGGSRAHLSVSRGSCPCRSRAVVETAVLGREEQVGQGKARRYLRLSMFAPYPQGCALLVHDCTMIAVTASHRKPHRYGSVPYFNSGGGTRDNVPDSVQVLAGGRR